MVIGSDQQIEINRTAEFNDTEVVTEESVQEAEAGSLNTNDTLAVLQTEGSISDENDTSINSVLNDTGSNAIETDNQTVNISAPETNTTGNQSIGSHADDSQDTVSEPGSEQEQLQNETGLITGESQETTEYENDTGDMTDELNATISVGENITIENQTGIFAGNITLNLSNQSLDEIDLNGSGNPDNSNITVGQEIPEQESLQNESAVNDSESVQDVPAIINETQEETNGTV